MTPNDSLVDHAFLEVLCPDLDVRMTGGQQIQHDVTQPLQLTVQSHDPADESAVFSYTWACYVMTSLDDAVLYTNNFNYMSGMGELEDCGAVSGLNSGTVLVDTSSFSIGDIVLFEVVATVASDDRKSRAVQIVSMVEQPGPGLELR